MIPKIIHYCWFGGKEMPEEYKGYLEGWRSFHPDWEIRRWDERNSPVELPYLQNAQRENKWANVSNFIRLHSLSQYGGVYLDTDVKMIKPMDGLLGNECFLGFEEGQENNPVFWVNNAVVGAIKEHPFILTCYEALLTRFDGTEDANLSGPRLTTELLKEKYRLKKYGYQVIDGITLYPTSYFYPIHYNETRKLENLEQYIDDRTIAVHMWSRSWLSSSDLLRMLDDLRDQYNNLSAKAGLYENSIRQLAQNCLPGDQVGVYQTPEVKLPEPVPEPGLAMDFIHDSQKNYFGLIEKLRGLASDVMSLQTSSENSPVEARMEQKRKEQALSILNEIIGAQKKYDSEKFFLVQKIENARLEIALLKQQASFNEDQLSSLRTQLSLLVEAKTGFQSRVTEMENELNTLKSQSAQQSRKNEILEHDKLRLASTLEMMQRELNAKTSQLTSIRNEKQISDENAKAKESEILSLQRRTKEAECSISTIKDELERSRQEIKGLQQGIDWYKRTYEDRRLAGIMLDRVKKTFNQSIPRHTDKSLEGRITQYNLGNPLLIRHVNCQQPVSIIMLSYNRFEDTAKSVKNIYKHTRIPFELIILDNNSDDKVKTELKKLPGQYKNLKVVLETINLGCAKGRMKAKRYAQHDYLLFLDNDILVTPFYLENLFAVIHRSDAIAGVCCKVVFPNGKIQFNGGRMKIDDGYALYSLCDEGADFNDPVTNRFAECEWIPGGATLWKRKIFEAFEIDEHMKGSFEDNEISYRITHAGYKLMNSPASIVIHDHFDFKNAVFKKAESAYFTGRNDAGRIQEALLHFYRKHRLIFSFAWKNNPWDLMWGLHSKEEVMKFISEKLPPNEHINSLRYS